MSQRFSRLRALFAGVSKFLNPRPRAPVPRDSRSLFAACKQLAFQTACEAGLDGRIEAFDGSMLHPAADGICTIRMTLRDGRVDRSPAEAAAAILASLNGLRVLLLLEIDGSRFVKMAPNVNPGVRELGRSFTDRTERAG